MFTDSARNISVADIRRGDRKVRFQQGRAVLGYEIDSGIDLLEHQRETALRDVFGRTAFPRARAGFAIRTNASGSMSLTPGHAYVDGVLVANPRELAYDIAGSLAPNVPHVAILAARKTDYTFSLRDDIREPALGGVDTTARSTVESEIVVMPLTALLSYAGLADEDALIATLRAGEHVETPVCGPGTAALSLSIDVDAAPSVDHCILEPDAGYLGRDNVNYMIAVHEPSDTGAPSIKIARQRVQGRLVRIDGVFRIEGSPEDDLMAFSTGDTVELRDAVMRQRGAPGVLGTITREPDGSYTLPGAVTAALDFSTTVTIMRWDRVATLSRTGITGPYDPVDIGDGVVATLRGELMRGDRWECAARVETGGLLWPPYETPDGFISSFAWRGCALLATLRAVGGRIQVLSDLRDVCPDLAHITARDVAYDPGTCDLGLEAPTVQDALDAMCARLDQDGCTIRVRPTGPAWQPGATGRIGGDVGSQPTLADVVARLRPFLSQTDTPAKGRAFRMRELMKTIRDVRGTPISDYQIVEAMPEFKVADHAGLRVVDAVHLDRTGVTRMEEKVFLPAREADSEAQPFYLPLARGLDTGLERSVDDEVRAALAEARLDPTGASLEAMARALPEAGIFTPFVPIGPLPTPAPPPTPVVPPVVTTPPPPPLPPPPPPMVVSADDSVDTRPADRLNPYFPYRRLNLELMPGEHVWPDGLNALLRNMASVTVRGCRAGTPTLTAQTGIAMGRCVDVVLENLDIRLPVPTVSVSVTGGKSVAIEDVVVTRRVSTTLPLCTLEARTRVRVRESRFRLTHTTKVSGRALGVHVSRCRAHTTFENVQSNGLLVLGEGVPGSADNPVPALVEGMRARGLNINNLKVFDGNSQSNNAVRLLDCRLLGVVPGKTMSGALSEFGFDGRSTAGDLPFLDMYVDRCEFVEGHNVFVAKNIFLSGNRFLSQSSVETPIGADIAFVRFYSPRHDAYEFALNELWHARVASGNRAGGDNRKRNGALLSIVGLSVGRNVRHADNAGVVMEGEQARTDRGPFYPALVHTSHNRGVVTARAQLEADLPSQLNNDLLSLHSRLVFRMRWA